MNNKCWKINIFEENTKFLGKMRKKVFTNTFKRIIVRSSKQINNIQGGIENDKWLWKEISN